MGNHLLAGCGEKSPEHRAPIATAKEEQEGEKRNFVELFEKEDGPSLVDVMWLMQFMG